MKHQQNHLRRMIAMMILIGVASLFSPSFARAQGGSYSENFDGALSGWKYGDAWQVNNSQFLGRGAGEAIYVDQQWNDMVFSFTVRSLSNILRASFHSDGGQRYYAELAYDQQAQIAVRLVRQAPGSDDVTLGQAAASYTPDQFKLQGLAVDITADHGKFEVAFNGKAVLDATDDKPLPGGWIGFETLDQSFAAIDNLSVTPLEITPAPPTTRGVDLVVRDVRVDRFERGSVIAVLAVDLANLGSLASPGFDVQVSDQQDGLSNTASVDPLAGGETRTLTISLEGPDAWQQTQRRFQVVIDPAGRIDDANRDNNTFVTGPVDVPNLGQAGPGPQPLPTPGPSPFLVGGVALALVGMAVVAGATGLILRQQTKVGQRRAWEKQAQQGQPPDRCSPPGYYVQVESQVDLKPLRITQLLLTATDPGRESVRRKQDVKGDIAAALKAAILADWLREPQDRFAPRIAGLSRDMSQTLIEFFQREQGRCDLAISAHLEGIEVTAAFTLYKCEKQGADGVWKKIDSWQKKKTQKRDDVIGRLPDRDPEGTLVPGGFSTELEPLLRQYVETYRVM